MATRPYFIPSNDIDFFKEKQCDFKFYTGFALSQKQKSIRSFHEEIKKHYPKAKILEVSRKSENNIGIMLSAFNLIYINDSDKKQYPVENIFQASKVFQNGGPYLDLLKCTPSEAKRDIRLKESGLLKEFRLNNNHWELEPKTMFYDYIYISALNKNNKLGLELQKYDIFTDIEFNPKKSLNCQARSVAIYVSLARKNLINQYLHDKNLFKTIYKNIL